MKSLVESLVSGVTVIAQKSITRDATWTYNEEVIYYKKTTYTKTDGSTGTGYSQQSATITFSGKSSQISSAVISSGTESPVKLTIQLNSYTLSDIGEIEVSIACSVPETHSLRNTGRTISDTITVNIPKTAWDKKDTYRFFN